MSELAICSEKTSDLLIRSFIMSDLSDSLTVSHFILVIWENERIPNSEYLLLVFGEKQTTNYKRVLCPLVRS